MNDKKIYIEDKGVIMSSIFLEGDEIMHVNNYLKGLSIWFIATQEDVDNYSGNNGNYIIKQN